MERGQGLAAQRRPGLVVGAAQSPKVRGLSMPRTSMLPIQCVTGSPFMQMKAPGAGVGSVVPARALFPFPGRSGHSPRSRRTAVPQLFWKDRKFNRRSASNSASAARRQRGDSTRTSPAPHRNRRPFMPEARKTSVGWRSAGLWHERTRRATSGGLSTWDRPRFSRPAPNLQNRTMVTHFLRSTGNSGRFRNGLASADPEHQRIRT